MESTEERIMHYQRGIDRSVAILDKPRLLHCIKALSKLPVTMRHLKSTGIGRTVNSLRKLDEGVGEASKRLVTKWKDMVSNAPDSGESDEACVPDDPDNYESVNYEESNSPGDETENYNGISMPEALDKPALSPPMVIDVNISPEEPEEPEEPVPNLSDEEEEDKEEEEEPEETSYSQSSKYSASSKDTKDSKKESKSHRSSSSSRNSDSRDKKESSKVSKNSKDNGHEEHKRKDKDKDKDKDRSKSRSESSSSKDKKSSSDAKKRKVESSDDESSRKKRRLSVCENETSDNDDEEPNNFVIDDGDNNHGSSSDERDKNGESSKQDRHKESSLKHSDSKSKSKDRHRSSSSSSSSKAKSSSSSSSKKDDKHKSKSSSSSSSSSKETNGKEKDRHSKDEKEKEKSKNDEKSKSKEKKDKKSKESKESKEPKEPKEPKDKKKSKKGNGVDDSIDSMSGTSFADALGMCSMPPPKKKKEKESSSKKEQSSPQPSPSKSSKSSAKTEFVQASPPPEEDSPDDSLRLLSPNVKLEPLAGDINEEIDLASTLPEPSPFYKPLPAVNHVQRRVDEEAMLAQVINAKVQRTKVYSGNKSGWTTVPSLQEICVRVLIENIDALEYTGGVPYDILQPILERASADQLQRLEYYNPYLVEETDLLWKFHCNKIFKTKLREEMESWREMYERCVSEREAKFKAITANIKKSRDNSVPVRSTKVAYVDHFVKPPRNVLRQQAKYGTAKVSTSASDLKKKLITGGAGPSSSSSGSSNVERISVPPPPASRSRPPTSNPIKKAKAPLMAKALQAIKGRYKR